MSEYSKREQLKQIFRDTYGCEPSDEALKTFEEYLCLIGKWEGRIDTFVDSDGTCVYCGKKDVFCRRCGGLMANERCWHTRNGHYCVGCAQEMGWE